MTLSRRALFAGAAAIVAAAAVPKETAEWVEFGGKPDGSEEQRLQLLNAIRWQFEKICNPPMVMLEAGPIDLTPGAFNCVEVDWAASRKIRDADWSGLTTLLEAWEQLTGDSVGAVKLALDTPIRTFHGGRIVTAKGDQVTFGPRLPAEFRPGTEFVAPIDGPYKPAS